MIRLIRITGFLLIVAGAIVLATWLIEPLRGVWPWIRQLPWPIQLGFAMAGAGLLLLLASLLWERWEDREQDAALRDELDDGP